VRHDVPALVSDVEPTPPDPLRPGLLEAAREIRAFDGRVRGIERCLEALFRRIESRGRLRAIPGVGLLNATALVAFIGDGHRFPLERHFTSHLVLAPCERAAQAAEDVTAVGSPGYPVASLIQPEEGVQIRLVSRRWCASWTRA
jgi:transposase